MTTTLLLIFDTNVRTRAVVVDRENGLTVGRDERTDLSVDDPGLSRRHFELASNNGEMRLLHLDGPN